VKSAFSKVIILGGILTLISNIAVAEVFLPGMQPKEAGIEFAKVQQCRMCHAGTKNKDADPFVSWQSGIISISAKDPIFRAALAIANQDIEGIGEFCLRCHAPRAWLEGRSTPTDGSTLNTEDMYGISCTVCHSYIDPLSAEAAKIIKDVPPGHGNAMMVSDPQNVVREPYGDGKGAMPHEVLKSPFHTSSNLCGVCHNISNPLLAEDVKKQPPTFSVIFSELTANGCSAILQNAARTEAASHAITGRLMAEGRRMWVNAVFLGSSGKVLKEIGKYAEKDDTIFGESVKAPTLLDPEQTRVYEILFGISEAQAKKYSVKPGKSFHSVLNDTILKDNRIPPEGFSNAAFREHLSQPVGATYADGQYWDEFELDLPEGCKKVVVRLMYESVSWEYLKFLAEENKTNDLGKRLYDVWTKTGKCPPTVMVTIEKSVE